MKKLLFSLLLTILPLTLIPVAHAQDSNWVISDYHSQITVAEDSSFIVETTIKADFTNSPHHGIIHDILINYTRNGQNYNLRINLLAVTDEQGNPLNYETSYYDRYLSLKIGDADKTYQEIKTYRLKYQVKRAVNFFADHAEVWWNVTGDQNEIPILKSSAEVIIPEGGAETDLQTACYTGSYGSTEQACTSTIKNSQTFTFQSERRLEPGEGLTIIAGFPKDILTEPSATQKFFWFIVDNFFYPFPFLVLALMTWLWFKKGRDPEKRTIIPRWELPKNLTASEIGTIIDEKADIKDISAAIIEMAVKGFLKIKEIEKKGLFKKADYEFIKLKEPDETLKTHEKEILSAVFGGSETKRLSALKEKFYVHLPEIKKQLYETIVSAGFFPKSPEKTRGTYLGIGLVVLMAGVIGGPIFSSLLLGESYIFQIMFALITSGIIIMIFGRAMPRKTKTGMQTYEHILGLKKYIETAEKDRLKFQEKAKIFEKLLAPAMVMGVADKWAKAFRDIYKNPPDWYEGRYDAFNSYVLISHLNNFTTSNSNTFTSTPGGGAGSGGSGFGGGGFSGGGFGGGGTSGW